MSDDLMRQLDDERVFPVPLSIVIGSMCLGAALVLILQALYEYVVGKVK
jgi:hypothetical protein